jgi:hypothetical protein
LCSSLPPAELPASFTETLRDGIRAVLAEHSTR